MYWWALILQTASFEAEVSVKLETVANIAHLRIWRQFSNAVDPNLLLPLVFHFGNDKSPQNGASQATSNDAKGCGSEASFLC